MYLRTLWWHFTVLFCQSVFLESDQGLCNGRAFIYPSVRPSVFPVDRQQQRRAAGLLLSALQTADVDRQLRPRC